MKRVTVAVLLLAVVGVAACGDDEPARPNAEVPEWAHVAPEQIAEAKKHGVPVAFENDLGMRFVLIPAGTFLMGTPEDERERQDNETQHEVTISRASYMQTTEVTMGVYRSLPSNRWPGKLLEVLPATGVTWPLAIQFAEWLSGRAGGRSYRLPTEAEWEYACRARTTTPFSMGTTISTDQANYNGSNSYPATQPRTPSCVMRNKMTPVGSFPPNPWGLYDMHGNAGEWCQDWLGEYPSRRVIDPTGPGGNTEPGNSVRYS